MSFNNLPGQTLTDSNGTVYIISDTFSVLHPGEQEPNVYEWSDLSSVRLTESSLIISHSGESYTLTQDCFHSRKQFLTVSTLAVINAKAAHISVSTAAGLLPDKYLYDSYDIPANAIFAQGEYNIKDIKSSLLLLLVGKFSRILWCVGIIGGLLSLLLFNIFIGFSENNWWYLLIGGFFCGVGCVALLYIIVMIVSRIHYSAIFNSYIRHNDNVMFAICPEGFSACESDVYTPTEIIRWKNSYSYIETSTMFIVTIKKHPLLWLPKQLFTKEQQEKIAAILTLNLSEK